MSDRQILNFRSVSKSHFVGSKLRSSQNLISRKICVTVKFKDFHTVEDKPKMRVLKFVPMNLCGNYCKKLSPSSSCYFPLKIPTFLHKTQMPYSPKEWIKISVANILSLKTSNCSFLPFRFYVKSVLVDLDLKSLKVAFLTILETNKFWNLQN